MKRAIILGVGFTLLGFLLPPVISLEVEYPACVTNCTQAVLECDPTNAICICTASPLLKQGIIACVKDNCTVKQGFSAAGAISLMCHVPVRSRSEAITATTATSGVLSFIATSMRTSVALSQGSFGLDDASAIVAELAGISFTVVVFYQSLIGLGKDTYTVDPEDIYPFLKLTYYGQGIYFWCSGFTKLCFLFFFLRIFPSQRTRMFCFIGIVASVLYTLAYSIAAWLQCKPISASWEAWDGEHGEPDYCINLNTFWYAASGVNIALDLVIAAIPIPELVTLNLSWRKKGSLIAIFGVGFITIMVSCVRLPTLHTYGNTYNPLWNHSWGNLVSTVELNVGVICICLPSFRRFFQRFIPKLCGGTSTPDSNYRHYDDDHTPRKRRIHRDSDLFNTVTKAGDTRVVTVQEDDDDEIELMELGKGTGRTASIEGSTESQQDMYEGPEQQHQG
ncbi:hypothetical protein P153DRAFT_398683 [Dothidotthia symphoricarpi CBS 119687]|uniref:Uncharacterized protein n=1 Tax=Dothidotthia symphoricarpi CBS 119687 TaxID=1392245 RepID=A0A6A6A929_9PLEO|nr:uncharacterized protein P153DRAFT_398683 [Dothidotthia symphoricarpi CBS 119687]KAF2127338.1 hypothetical protein P153DRAFT_398683 [Dothidotthia symphoricarpi CBS 119687]